MVNLNRSSYVGYFRIYVNMIGAIVIACLSLITSIIFLPTASPARAQGGVLANPIVLSESIDAKACDLTGVVTTVVAMQGWHGQINHLLPPPYDSADPEVIAKQIALAQELCISALVLDWYGPEANLPNDLDRAHMDLVFENMLSQMQGKPVKGALMYDENTITQAKITDPQLIEQRVISDLQYAKDNYFNNSNYWKIDGQPVLFIFPYREIDKQIDWNHILTELDANVKLVMMWAKDLDYDHYLLVIDGFYGWVQVDNPIGYLDEFYTTMSQTYTNKLVFGGVWPGFDDSLAAWGLGRYLSRACGQTWLDTWTKVEASDSPYALISTLNDYEEGTDIEQGVVKLVTDNNGPILPGETATLTAFMADCQDVTYTWNFGDGTSGSGITTTHTYAEPGIYPAIIAGTYTPINAPNTTMTLTASTTVRVSCTAWEEDFDPLDSDQWTQPTAIWTDTAGPTAILTENSPNDNFGKAETIPLSINMNRYRYLRVKVVAVDKDAKFTVQILDKTGGGITATNVITDAKESNEYTVNLAEKLNWSGQKKFTINLWVIGEGMSVTYEHISLRNQPTDTDHCPKIYLPLVQKNL